VPDLSKLIRWGFWPDERRPPWLNANGKKQEDPTMTSNKLDKARVADLHAMAVDVQREKIWNVPGRFGWDGGFGTSAYSDPKNDFIGILMTQCLMDSPKPPAVFEDFWTHAYRSL
jgi:CubicO group peptidase (beta-lactamase class C family)